MKVNTQTFKPYLKGTVREEMFLQQQLNCIDIFVIWPSDFCLKQLASYYKTLLGNKEIVIIIESIFTPGLRGIIDEK